MEHSPILLPALRGYMGDWIFYSCLIPLREIEARVDYAEDIHPDKQLSALIQRALEEKRGKEISEYLLTTQERFFNSLVLATYGGEPEWVEVGNFRSGAKSADVLKNLPEEASDTLGFLSLSGKEKIFAIDGQHRLAGIKEATKASEALGNEHVSVLLVGHKKDPAGMERTRRLFTTLNKTAVPVRKRDIIALDEDDAMAIVARRLVEGNPHFKHPRIAVVSSQNIPSGNRVSLTTISSLYDILKLVFINHTRARSDRKLRFNRPTDERLDEFEAVAVDYFFALTQAFPEVGSVLTAPDPAATTEVCRGDHGGHLLFRPIGLEMFTQVAIEYAAAHDVPLLLAVKRLSNLPMQLVDAPYRHVIWNPVKNSVAASGKLLARDLVRHMAGLATGDTLLERYKRTLKSAGVEVDELPPKLH
jgi:DNA sulfur modification protein DndB